MDSEKSNLMYVPLKIQPGDKSRLTFQVPLSWCQGKQGKIGYLVPSKQINGCSGIILKKLCSTSEDTLQLPSQNIPVFVRRNPKETNVSHPLSKQSRTGLSRTDSINGENETQCASPESGIDCDGDNSQNMVYKKQLGSETSGHQTLPVDVNKSSSKCWKARITGEKQKQLSVFKLLRKQDFSEAIKTESRSEVSINIRRRYIHSAYRRLRQELRLDSKSSKICTMLKCVEVCKDLKEKEKRLLEEKVRLQTINHNLKKYIRQGCISLRMNDHCHSVQSNMVEKHNEEPDCNFSNELPCQMRSAIGDSLSGQTDRHIDSSEDELCVINVRSLATPEKAPSKAAHSGGNPASSDSSSLVRRANTSRLLVRNDPSCPSKRVLYLDVDYSQARPLPVFPRSFSSFTGYSSSSEEDSFNPSIIEKHHSQFEISPQTLAFTSCDRGPRNSFVRVGCIQPLPKRASSSYDDLTSCTVSYEKDRIATVDSEMIMSDNPTSDDEDFGVNLLESAYDEEYANILANETDEISGHHASHNSRKAQKYIKKLKAPSKKLIVGKHTSRISELRAMLRQKEADLEKVRRGMVSLEDMSPG